MELDLFWDSSERPSQAAASGNCEVLHLLHLSGADLAMRDQHMLTPAHRAADTGHVEVRLPRRLLYESYYHIFIHIYSYFFPFSIILL